MMALVALVKRERDWRWRCPMAKTVDGELEPCGRHGTTVITYQFDGEWFTEPACPYHAHRAGKDNTIPLARLLEAAREAAS